MSDEDWHGLDDDALERMLVERWLVRGVTLAVILFAAITVTWVAARGVTTTLDYVTVGALLALAVAAGVAGFSMRRQDLRIHRELRRRRRSGVATDPRR